MKNSDKSEADVLALLSELQIHQQELITQRKLLEKEFEESAQLISLINTPGNLRELMSSFSASLQIWSGCEAVGIRLRSGEDYPYFETRGFPPEFVQTEKYLCSYGTDGKIRLDPFGNPVLECMCGIVLHGLTDPSKPYFTVHGSFWKNSTSSYLTSTTDAERASLTRNRCNRDGYESVALIPLRNAGQVFGLLQFNDHRPDRFTESKIAHFEKMADTLAIAISRRQAEDALLESENKYRDLVENSPDAIAIYRDRKVVFANSECIRLIAAKNLSDLVGKSLIEFVHPDYRAFVIERMKKVVNKGTVLPIAEEKFLQIDGTEIDVEVKAMSIIFENLPSVQLILRDITQRKQTEIKLIESEERYKRITEGITDYLYTVIVKNGKAVKTINNEACKEITGYSSKEFSNDPYLWINMVVPEEKASVANRFLKILNNDELPPSEHRIICKNGKIRWIRDTAIPKYDSKGKLISYDGVIKDITKQKQMDQVLNTRLHLSDYAHTHSRDEFQQELLDKLELLTESEIGFFHAIDADQNNLILQSWSTNTLEKMCKTNAKGQHYNIDMAGVWVDCFHQRKAVIHNDYLSLPHKKGMPPGHAPVIRELAVPILRNNKIVAIVGVGNRPNDYTKREIDIVSLLSDMAWDIIERKLAEEEVISKNEELLLANSEKDKFFSIIAHDLRSPFNAFLGFTQMMAEELNNLSINEVQRIAVSMKTSATNLFHLLENLLEWSRFQRGVTSFDPVPFFILPRIRECLESVLESASKKGIEINLNIPEDALVYADMNMFGSVIRNLTYNAVKFTSKGGRVNLVVKSISENFAEISIIDNGIGMNKEIMDNLFRLNETSKRTGTDGEPSTGLGLIICKEFVEKHGGNIRVESETGKGSTFIFTLPNSPAK